MGILQIATDSAGLIGVNPRRLKIISSDNLATVTAAGYLNPISLEGYNIYNTDIIDMWYGAVGTVGGIISSPGTYEEFIPSISNGVITLVAVVSAGNVLLPVVSGDFAVFNGTSGQLKDSGALPSNAADPYVVMSPGSITVGHLLKAGDANGSIADQGVQLKSVAQAAVAGGAAAQTVTDAFCTSASCVVASWNDTTNAVSIQKVAAGAGSFVVTSSADPGASHLNYIITKV